MRIIAFSERLSPPFDEGIKSFALQLIQAMRVEHDVLALTSDVTAPQEHGIVGIPANRLLLSASMRMAER